MALQATTIRRVFAASLLAVAFVVMASVFSPDRTQAEFDRTREVIRRDELGIELSSQSSDAHEGLQSLGSIETATYIAQIYCTDVGPRYTIYDRITYRELATLLTVEQVKQSFPEIHLRDVDFAAPNDEYGPLMLAEPVDLF